MEVLRRDVIPVLAAFTVVASMAIYARRHPSGTERIEAPGWRNVVRHQVITIGLGYLVFLAIVLVFHVWIAGKRGAMISALGGGAFLAFAVAMPLFIAGSLIRARRDR